jgi:predicted O-linked N-acetylglucosamine transferase (SPINDLY family)
MATIAESMALAWQYHQAGRFAEAEQGYRQVLQSAPSHTDAWYLLGTACHVQGKLGDAVACYEQALRLRPDYAEVHSNLGVAYRVGGRIADAIAHFREALRLRPSFADAYSNLGVILADKGEFDEAIRSLREALRLQPSSPQAHFNLGNALQQQDLDEAAVCYRRAVELRPAYLEAYNNLGTVLISRGKLDEAAVCLRKALALAPGLAVTHNNLGNVFVDQGRPEEAAGCYGRALECQPDFARAHSNLLICLNYNPSIDLDVLFAKHRHWAERHATLATISPHANDRDPERPLRVGYFSPDFRHHAVAYFTLPIVSHHDPQRILVYGYAEVPAPDNVTRRFQSLAHGWRSTFGLSDAEVAEQIRTDRIDILVDLAGHTARGRLKVFALKPAPIQVAYLGYPNTTGLPTVDYRLADAVADPPGEPLRYTEEVVRLACAFCYAPPETAVEVAPLPALASRRLTFGSLHHLAKLNGQVLDLWCALLRALPETRLLVFRHSLHGSTRDYFHQQLVGRGIDPDRFELQAALGPGAHLGHYAAVDIALDAFPWSAHTTACESLWMGVPVLTLYGTRHAGRMAASILTSLGMTDWIARTPEEFIEIGKRQAADLERLGRLRSGLRALMATSQLCDGKSFTRQLEMTYRELWRRWCALEANERAQCAGTHPKRSDTR